MKQFLTSLQAVYKYVFFAYLLNCLLTRWLFIDRKTIRLNNTKELSHIVYQLNCKYFHFSFLP